MSFTFVHTADWQIGKPFGAFPDDVRVLLREARLDSVGRIAGVALGAGAQHVLVAGDVFDSGNPPSPVVLQLLSRMTAHKSLTWHLLPGNHDPAQSGGVWDFVRTKTSGSNVRLYLAAEPAEIAPHVLLLPAPLKSKSLAHDPTAYMDGIGSADGMIRIGLAHGSVQGFGSLGDAAVPIDPARDRLARLDYFALGDWHGRTRISDRTWYSGTPEPDGFKDNDPGSVLVVELGGPSSPPRVTPVATQKFMWLQQALALSTLRDVDAAAEAVSKLAVAIEHRIVRVSLSGDIGIDELAQLEVLQERVSGLVRYLDWDQTGLRIANGEIDLAAYGSATVSALASTLAREANGQDARAAAVASEALMLLTQFTRGAGV